MLVSPAAHCQSFRILRQGLLKVPSPSGGGLWWGRPLVRCKAADALELPSPRPSSLERKEELKDPGAFGQDPFIVASLRLTVLSFWATAKNLLPTERPVAALRVTTRRPSSTDPMPLPTRCHCFTLLASLSNKCFAQPTCPPPLRRRDLVPNTQAQSFGIGRQSQNSAATTLSPLKTLLK